LFLLDTDIGATVLRDRPRGLRPRFNHEVERLAVLPFDAAAASHFADIRADLTSRGALIGGYDLMIAGQARSRGLTVVSHNTRAFNRVRGLQVADWLAEMDGDGGGDGP
jgi:tRNA(fMet)-specific endonuclease VapC